MGWFKSFFKSKKEKSESEKVVEIMDPAIAWCASSWTEFYKGQTLVVGRKLKLNFTLYEIVLDRMAVRLKTDYPILNSKEGEVIIAAIVAKGIEISGTHTKEEIEKAIGAPIPF